MSLLLKIDSLVEGEIVKRPSKFIKSPYVADIKFNTSEVLGHTASLGCCGLADVGATILMAPVISKKNKKEQENEKLSCAYRVYLSVLLERNTEFIVGIHPKLAENLVEAALKSNLLSRLQNIKRYKREVTIYAEGKVDSRFDFTGIDCNNIPFIMEVKNVPLADYEDVLKKDRNKMCYDDRELCSKVAYFPDGYRKKSADPVSPRALKHIRELTLIKRESKTRCIMCYVIQRTDVDRFQPSIVDPEYREAVKIALESGVEIITLVTKWTKEGEAYFVRDDLPITPF
uniref:Sugar fermentation stimulation protein C-terminal domain-containing protein n=1 Tax=viral metagenome TaxID=1070528 RepID=A0A6C0I633_9ZZZZ